MTKVPPNSGIRVGELAESSVVLGSPCSCAPPSPRLTVEDGGGGGIKLGKAERISPNLDKGCLSSPGTPPE